MFLTEEDYIGVCDDISLDVIQQSEARTRQRAERTAIEEVSSYLRSRYDIKKAYQAKEDERNAMLAHITANITLYYLIHWLPQNMGLEARKDLYDDAILWLRQVQAGKATPDLPTYVGEDGETDTKNPMRYGSMRPNRYDY